MIDLDEYYQGESIPITLTLTDRDGNAIDLDSLDDITVTVFHKRSLIIMGTFTLSGGTVTKTTPASGILDVKLDGTDTDGESTGIYVAQVDTEETDADYTPLRYRYGQEDTFILLPSI